MNTASPSSRLQSEINVTPLVDVCLVLLIIFMIVLPTVVNGIPVRLPEANSSTNAEKAAILISVREGEIIYLDAMVIRRDQLEGELQRLARAEGPTRAILVRGDKRLQYGAIVAVLNACRQAGFEQVALATQKPGAT